MFVELQVKIREQEKLSHNPLAMQETENGKKNIFFVEKFFMY